MICRGEEKHRQAIFQIIEGDEEWGARGSIKWGVGAQLALSPRAACPAGLVDRGGRATWKLTEGGAWAAQSFMAAGV